MEVIGCTPGSCSEIDWPEVWRQSPEYAELHRELDRMKKELPRKAISSSIGEPREYEEFAAPFWLQLWECLKRANSFYWHDPSYIYSKTALCLFTVSSTDRHYMMTVLMMIGTLPWVLPLPILQLPPEPTEPSLWYLHDDVNRPLSISPNP